jgi:hypothetical protein
MATTTMELCVLWYALQRNADSCLIRDEAEEVSDHRTYNATQRNKIAALQINEINV